MYVILCVFISVICTNIGSLSICSIYILIHRFEQQKTKTKVADRKQKKVDQLCYLHVFAFVSFSLLSMTPANLIQILMSNQQYPHYACISVCKKSKNNNLKDKIHSSVYWLPKKFDCFVICQWRSAFSFFFLFQCTASFWSITQRKINNNNNNKKQQLYNGNDSERENNCQQLSTQYFSKHASGPKAQTHSHSKNRYWIHSVAHTEKRKKTLLFPENRFRCHFSTSGWIFFAIVVVAVAVAAFLHCCCLVFLWLFNVSINNIEKHLVYNNTNTLFRKV